MLGSFFAKNFYFPEGNRRGDEYKVDNVLRGFLGCLMSILFKLVFILVLYVVIKCSSGISDPEFCSVCSFRNS